MLPPRRSPSRLIGLRTFDQGRQGPPSSGLKRTARESNAGERHVDGDGNSLTVATDADLAMMLMRLIGNGDPVPARLRDFALAQWQRPSMREWVEHKRPPYVPY